MSVFIRRVVGAALLVGALVGGASASAAARPATPTTPAQAGAGWLGRQFTGDGFIRFEGKPDPGATAEAVLAFASAGVGATQAHAAIAWLEKHFESYVSPGGTDDAGALATVALAAEALGDNPARFGGTKPADNLIARLEATQRTSGTDAGLFGASDPTYDGAFRQGLALMALAVRGISNPSGVAWLEHQQCADGGWQAYRSDVAVPCPAPNPTTSAGPDTNSTALAVEALVATGATFAHDPTAFFASAQNSDGGFGFIGSPSEAPDADSTGEVIQALVALHQLSNPEFTKPGGLTPTGALEGFQVGCSAAPRHRGAYAFQPVDGVLSANLLATLQAVPGAAQVAFPFGRRHLAKGLPKLTCHDT